VTLDVGLVQSLEGIQWSDVGYRLAPGYNGGAVGPTLRVKPGDILTVTLNNKLDPSPARDRELNDYVMNPKSDDANVTVIYNRLTAIGNLVRSQTDRTKNAKVQSFLTPITCRV
jgi:FtsP/CotA-like multicopper oxidase with cupredoxin domain